MFIGELYKDGKYEKSHAACRPFLKSDENTDNNIEIHIEQLINSFFAVEDNENFLQIFKKLKRITKHNEFHVRQTLFDFLIYILSQNNFELTVKSIYILNQISTFQSIYVKDIIFPNNFVNLIASFFPNEYSLLTLGNFIILAHDVAFQSANEHILEYISENSDEVNFAFFMFAFSYHQDLFGYSCLHLPKLFQIALSMTGDSKIGKYCSRTFYKIAKHQISILLQFFEFQKYCCIIPKSRTSQKYTLKTIYCVLSFFNKTKEADPLLFFEEFLLLNNLKTYFEFKHTSELAIKCFLAVSKNNSEVASYLLNHGIIQKIVNQYDTYTFSVKRESHLLFCNLILSSSYKAKWEMLRLGIIDKVILDVLLNTNDDKIYCKTLDSLRHIVTSAAITRNQEIIHIFFSLDQLLQFIHHIQEESTNEKILARINEFLDAVYSIQFE